MTATLTQPLSAAEFFDWVHRPENAGRVFELERGEVVEMSRPGERHGFVCGNFARIIGNYTFERRQGYVCSNDTGVIWEDDPATVRGPDVIYYAQSRPFGELTERYSDEVPALVVEVVSPTDRPGALNVRLAQFLGWGVRAVWLVDPQSQTVSVYRASGPFQVFGAGDALVCEDVLPGFACPVADLFYTPGMPPPATPPAVAPVPPATP